MTSYYGIQNIFSLASRQHCLSNLKKIVTHEQFVKSTDADNSKTTTRRPGSLAAVLVALCDVEGSPALLYTLRTIDLRTSSSELSFPGGRSEPDESATETALRYAYQDIRLPREKVEVWGHAPALPAHGDVLITPVLACLKDVSDEDYSLDPEEVAQVHTVPVEMLCNYKNQFYTQFRNGFIFPVFTAKQYKIWGATAYITHIFLNSILSSSVYNNKWMNKKLTQSE